MKRSTKALSAIGAASALTAGAVMGPCQGTPPPPDPAVSACVEYPVVPVEPSGAPWPPYTETQTNPVTYNATGATFSTGERSDVWSVKFRTANLTEVCLYQGLITTELPESTVWADWHHNGGLTTEVPTTVVGTRFDNVGDGAAFYAPDWTLHGVHMTRVHDDCVEDDRMLPGRVIDSLLDGCAVGFSAWSQRDQDGTAHDIEITGTLIRLEAFEHSYDPGRFGYWQHGGFFKFQEGRHPRLVIRDSAFRADQPGKFGGNVNGHLGLPPGSECDGVTLIGTETWPARELESWQQQCTDLTLGTVSDWDQAVTDHLEES